MQLGILLLMGAALGRGVSYDPLPYCPYPGSGTLYVYGTFDYLAVLRNHVDHSGKQYRDVPRSRKFWDIKYFIHLKVDSLKGMETVPENLTTYPGDYFPDTPEYSEDIIAKYLSERRLFFFEKHGEEYVLTSAWTPAEIRGRKVFCQERTEGWPESRIKEWPGGWTKGWVEEWTEPDTAGMREE